MDSIDDVTPAQWDQVSKQKDLPSAREEFMRLAREFPAIERETVLPTDAKERKSIPIYTGFINYFPLAIAAVARLSLRGGIQHGQTPETLHWDRAKSGDELDALMRHMIDGDWEQVAWRAMANLQKKEEEKREQGV